MAIKGAKLLKLLEQHQTAGTGAAGYKKDIRSFLGIQESDFGDPTLGNSKKCIEAKDIDLGEIAHTFLGRHFGASDVRHAFKVQEQFGNLQEAEGSVVLPSQFANISAFTDTVAGLVDAMTMEGYQDPIYIGDEVFETVDARVNGGYAIGVMNDGKTSGDLLDGQPYPTVGLKETKVHIPDNQRHGNVIQINERVFTYDLTGQVQEMCLNAGNAVRRNKEIRQADTALGVTNTYERDGVSSNTFLTAAGTVPNNYVNSSTNPLTDWNAIDRGLQVLWGNTDPGTGFEISIPIEGLDLLVMYQKRFNASTILQPEWIRQSTNSAVDLRQAKSPIPSLNMIVANQIWYNRLIAAGVNTTNAPQRWQMGKFKKAFKYRSIVPFQVNSAPLSSEDVRLDIVSIYIAREIGTSWVKEPRYAYQGTSE